MALHQGVVTLQEEDSGEEAEEGGREEGDEEDLGVAEVEVRTDVQVRPSFQWCTCILLVLLHI